MLFGATNVDISTNCSKLLTYDGYMPAKIKVGIGGGGSNIAYNLSVQNAYTKFVTVLSNNVFGKYILEHLKTKCLDLSDVQTCNQKSSFYVDLNTDTKQSKKEQQLIILRSILNEMNSVYEIIDPNGNLHFEDLFTKKDEVYSGSEATIFHLSCLYALSKILNHTYPIIIDSFRAEDLSTKKKTSFWIYTRLYRIK